MTLLRFEFDKHDLIINNVWLGRIQRNDLIQWVLVLAGTGALQKIAIRRGPLVCYENT